jgi:hypothetical protein
MSILNRTFCLHINYIKNDVNLLNHDKRVLTRERYISFIQLEGDKMGSEWSYHYRAQLCNSFIWASKLLG